MPIETLFLDAGGVLVFPNWDRISETLGRHGVDAPAQALRAAEPIIKREIDAAHTIAATDDDKRGWLYFDAILTRAGVKRSAGLADALRELYAYHQEFNIWESTPDSTAPALRQLRDFGLKLVVLSNANGRIGDVMERVGLLQYFDCVIDSFLENVEKPDPRLFQIAMSRVGARPETTMHVGDLYHVDVVGARAAGLSAVLVDPADLCGDFDCQRVRSLEGVVELLRNNH